MSSEKYPFLLFHSVDSEAEKKMINKNVSQHLFSLLAWSSLLDTWNWTLTLWRKIVNFIVETWLSSDTKLDNFHHSRSMLELQSGKIFSPFIRTPDAPQISVTSYRKLQFALVASFQLCDFSLWFLLFSISFRRRRSCSFSSSLLLLSLNEAIVSTLNCNFRGNLTWEKKRRDGE